MSAVPTFVGGSEPAELFQRCIEQKIPLMLFTPANKMPLQPRLYMLLAKASRETFGELETFPELAADHRMALVGGVSDGGIGVRLGTRLAQLLDNECHAGNRDDQAAGGPRTSIGVTMGLPQEDAEFSRYRHLAARAALSANLGGRSSRAVQYRGPGVLAATLKILEPGRDSCPAFDPQIDPMIDEAIESHQRRWKLPQPQIAHCIADLRQRWLDFETKGRSVGLISLRIEGLREWRNTPKSAAFVAHVLHLSNEFLTRRQHRVGSALYYIDHGEYALLVPGLDSGEADVIASMLQQSLLQKLQEQLPYEPPLSLTLGLGVATATPHRPTKSLVKLANDCDLYLAVNTVAVCEATVGTQADSAGDRD